MLAPGKIMGRKRDLNVSFVRSAFLLFSLFLPGFLLLFFGFVVVVFVFFDKDTEGTNFENLSLFVYACFIFLCGLIL